MMETAGLFLYATSLGAALGGYCVVAALVSLRRPAMGGRSPRGIIKSIGTFSGFIAEEAPGYGPGVTTASGIRRLVRGFLRRALPIAGTSAAVGVGCLAITGIPALGLVGAAAGLGVPVLIAKAAEKRRADRLRAAWPDACRHLVANLQVGDSLPHAVASLGTSGPAELRPHFARFAKRYTATGDFESAIGALCSELAFAGVDRHLGALRLAHRSGGAELVSVLRTAAELASERLATERDIKARQSWTVTAARVSAAAPWVILLLLSFRPATAAVYSTALGTKVILGGAISTALGYALMLKIGKVASQ